MGQGKSKISENNEIFDENSDIIKSQAIFRFRCIIIKDISKLTNKLGKKIFIELDEKSIKLIRKEIPIISIDYKDIDDWKFSDEDLIWCFCFRNYSKSENTSESDSLDLIELEEEVQSENNSYRICCKFNNQDEINKFENTLFIKLGQFMTENNIITTQEYKEWFSKYHK